MSENRKGRPQATLCPAKKGGRGSHLSLLQLFPTLWDMQFIAIPQYNGIFHYSLFESGFVSLHQYRTIGCHDPKIGRFMVRWKENNNFLTRFPSQINCRGHITVSGNQYGHVAVVLIGIRDDMGGKVDIRSLFLVCTDYIPTLITWDFLSDILTQDEFELGVFQICLKKGILTLTFLIVPDWSGREIFYSHQSLIWSHEFLKQLHNVYPIILSPLGSLFKSKIEIEAVDIYNDSLNIAHKQKNKPPIPRAGPWCFPTKGDKFVYKDNK